MNLHLEAICRRSTMSEGHRERISMGAQPKIGTTLNNNYSDLVGNVKNIPLLF